MKSLTIIIPVIAAAMLGGPVFANSPDDFGPTPIEKLQSIGIDTSPVSLLSLASDDAVDSNVRYLAIVALGRTRNTAYVPILEDFLSDASSEIRIGALIAIRTIAADSPQDRLVEVLNSDPDSMVRRVAITALETVGNDRSLESILSTAENRAGEADVRTEAIHAVSRMLNLKRVDFSRVRGRLKPLLQDADRDVRLATALVISAQGDPDAVPVLVDIAIDSRGNDWATAKAIRSIQTQTGHDFGYFKEDGAQKRHGSEKRQAIENIQGWWQQNRASYVTSKGETP